MPSGWRHVPPALGDAAPQAPHPGRPRPSARIPGLDGLRAISISLVLLGHLVGTRGFPALATRLPYAEIAYFGVRVFFVISGFLITTLLLDELGKTGRISLRQFYMRRTFRIFPAYIALLVVVFGLSVAGRITLARGDMLHAVTYTMNYHPQRSWWVGHLWSLAVEEQFYLLWPAVIVLTGRRRALWAAAGVVALVPLVRLAEWQLVPSMRSVMLNTFETCGDALAIGCLLAGTRDMLWGNARFRALVLSRWFIPAAYVVALGLSWRFRPSLLLGGTATNVVIALVIERCVRRGTTTAIGRVLNWTPIVFIGTLSYSLYLWQQLFINRDSSAVISAFPLNLMLALLAATASYYAVELPMLRARQSLARRMQGPRQRATADPAARASSSDVSSGSYIAH